MKDPLQKETLLSSITGIKSPSTKLKRRTKIAAFIALPLIALVAVAAAGNTAVSSFSDSQSGNLSGSIGSIKGSVSSNTLAFENLLPGEVQTVGATQTNTGKNAQDVYVVFNNADALHALNDLGSYGEFHLKANGVQLFDSANLNDNTGGKCFGAGQTTFTPDGCWPLAKSYLLASNVAPGASVNYSFGFGYADKLSSQSTAGGGTWNTYAGGSGLPYQIVETQVGKKP